jgi:hypothetical protein
VQIGGSGNTQYAEFTENNEDPPSYSEATNQN